MLEYTLQFRTDFIFKNLFEYLLRFRSKILCPSLIAICNMVNSKFVGSSCDLTVLILFRISMYFMRNSTL